LKRYYQEDRKVAMIYIGELVKSHPDKAGAILAQFMEEVTVINRMSFQSRWIELDAFVAFDFATLSFNAAHRGQPQMQALQRMVERGDLESAIEHSKRIGSFRHRAGVMQNVASKMSNDQVYEHADWFAS